MAVDTARTANFDLYLRALRFLGYSKSNSIYYKFYTGVTIFIAYIFMGSSLADLFIHANDLQRLMDTASHTLPFCLGMCIDLFVRIRGSELQLVVKRSYDFEIPKSSSSSLTPLISWMRNKGTRFMAVLLVIYLAFLLTRIWSHEDRTLLVNAWFPFDTLSTPTYQLIIIVQILGNTFFTAIFTTYLGSYFTLVIIACAQLDKLRMSLLDLKQGHDIEHQLKSYIRHHQLILEYMQLLEKVFNELLLSHFLLIMGSLCFTVIAIVLSKGDINHIGPPLMPALFLLFLLFCYCWFGQQLSVKVEGVSEAIWNCDWIGTSVSFQRSATFMIAIANKEFTLTAGKFVPVSNKTLVKVLQQTLSYLMFLLNLRN